MKAALFAATLASITVPAAAQPSKGPEPAPMRTTPFPDVPKHHWAYDAVEQLRQLGILRGYALPAPGKQNEGGRRQPRTPEHQRSEPRASASRHGGPNA